MSGPKITGPLARTNTFRLCDDTDKRESWFAATNTAMVALPYVKAGDVVYVADGGLHKWLVIPSASLTVGANVLNGTVVSVQFLRDGIQFADSTHDGLISSTTFNSFSALRNQIFKSTSLAAMQSITTAQEGDLCMVSIASPPSDALWYFVASAKYSLGANCLTSASSGLRCLYPIDMLSGTVSLVAGHASVYIPNIDSGSIPKAWYNSFAGQPGTLSAHMITNGVSIDSTSDTDGSTVGYEVTLLQ
jgi:hypothetical protein